MRPALIFPVMLALSAPAAAAADSKYYEPHFSSRMMTIATQTWGLGPGAVMLLGDSNTEMFRPIQMDGCQIINAGFGGARIADIASRAAGLASIVKPSIVHIMIGTNDINKLGNEAADLQISDDLASIVQVFKTSGATVVLWSVPPVGPKFAKAENRTAMNDIILRVAKEASVEIETDWAGPMIGTDGYANPGWILGDDVHLTPNGQIVRATRIAALDSSILKQTGKACWK